MKTLIVYDGTVHSKTALRYGLKKVKQQGGKALVLHLFNSTLFIDYGAGPRAEEVARAESARYLAEAKKILEEVGEIDACITSEEGDPEEAILRYATEEGVDIIISPPRYQSIMKNATCPVSIIPGTILIPVDNTEIAATTLNEVTQEAMAMGSKVIVLGIVPIHIYSKWERDELEKIRKETTAVVKKAKKMLSEKGIEVKEMILSGYPDEEIIKVAEGQAISMIMFPSGGDSPSEMSKAATIILDEQERLKRPVFLVPS